jgi:hypothetical protein
MSRRQGATENYVLQYEVARYTPYGEYTAVCRVDEYGRTTIAIYEGDPTVELLWGLVRIEGRPIVPPRRLGRYADVNNAITETIAAYEIPFYQMDAVEHASEELAINYAEELRKRRQRVESVDTTPETEETTQDFSKIKITAWDDPRDDETERQVRQVANRTGKSENSIRNLIQFRKAE